MRLINKSIFVIGLLLVAVFTSCEHRPLVDISNTHYVRVYLDEELKNVNCGFYNPKYEKPYYKTPEVMRVMLCDPKTGKKVAESYLQNAGKDERGNYLDGHIIVNPGKYSLMIYNFATESTVLRNEDNYDAVEAYTNPVPPMMYGTAWQSRTDINPEDILYDPDHLFVDTRRDLTLNLYNGVDTLFNEQRDFFTAQSVVKTYYLQVKVKGVEWISSMKTLLTGMARSVRLHDRKIQESSPIVLNLDMKIGETKETQRLTPGIDPNDKETAITEEGVIYTTFSTFGKVPNVNSVYSITFEFLKDSGEKQHVTIDITDLFKTKEAIEHQWLLIDQEIEIVPPSNFGDDGGFNPGVDDWKDNETDVII